jgi:hypothetical protein
LLLGDESPQRMGKTIRGFRILHVAGQLIVVP